MSKPLLSDLNDFIEDLGGVVEDTLVKMGFNRKDARYIIKGLEPRCRDLMGDCMAERPGE